MVGFLRCLLGVALLPLCWSLLVVLWRVLCIATGEENAFSDETIALLSGMSVFTLAWFVMSHPIRTYVLGHELTHALWGLFFGAKPSDMRVGVTGGSVKLTKNNFLITLAPYFFPFYTFVVIVIALITYAFVRPLPYLPAWLFFIGFTWAFHILFTFDSLSHRQPDVKLYGRIFSWTVILIGNILMVLVWLAATTSVSFRQLGDLCSDSIVNSYSAIGHWTSSAFKHTVDFISQFSNKKGAG